jgi:hypothetical protein
LIDVKKGNSMTEGLAVEGVITEESDQKKN